MSVAEVCSLTSIGLLECSVVSATCQRIPVVTINGDTLTTCSIGTELLTVRELKDQIEANLLKAGRVVRVSLLLGDDFLEDTITIARLGLTLESVISVVLIELPPMDAMFIERFRCCYNHPAIWMTSRHYANEMWAKMWLNDVGAPGIARLFNHSCWKVRCLAVNVLSRVNTIAQFYLGEIATLLHDPRVNVRIWAAIALGRIRTTPALQLLVEVIQKDSNSDVQCHACRILLVAIWGTRDGHWDYKWMRAVKKKSTCRSSVQALFHYRVHNRENMVGFNVIAESIANGIVSGKLLPSMIRFYEPIFACIGFPSLPHLGNLYKHSLKSVRLMAIRCLVALHIQCFDSVTIADPAFISLIRDQDPDVRSNALVALNRLNVPVIHYSEHLADLLVDTSASVRRKAAQTISANGLHLSEFLCEKLHSACPQTRRRAANMLGKVNAQARSCMTNLDDLGEHGVCHADDSGTKVPSKCFSEYPLCDVRQTS